MAVMAGKSEGMTRGQSPHVGQLLFYIQQCLQAYHATADLLRYQRTTGVGGIAGG